MSTKHEDGKVKTSSVRAYRKPVLNKGPILTNVTAVPVSGISSEGA
jgi:hypothetical protein